MNYKITIGNPGNHISNPLLKLADREFATSEDGVRVMVEEVR